MMNDWIDAYREKNITSELLFITIDNGDSTSSTFHQKCDGKELLLHLLKQQMEKE